MRSRSRLGPWLLGLLLMAGCSNDRIPTNVVLISIDTLRRRNVSCYGYDRVTTPNLDRFAEEGVIFRDAVCNSNNTLLSHVSMITSLYPSVHGAEPGVPLSESRETLAEVLKGHGYSTAFLGAHGDWLTPRYGFDQGFDHFESQYVKADRINQWAEKWLNESPHEPFFLFLHYYDAHSDFADEGILPYNAPDPFAGRFRGEYQGNFTGCDEKRELCSSEHLRWLSDQGVQLAEGDRDFIRDLYDEEVSYTDFMVGEILTKLKALGLYERSLILITSDHGEEFQEHGRFLHGSVHEEVVQVPLLVRFPGGRIRGEAWGQAEGIDLLPTILDVLDLPVPRGIQGESLLPLIDGETPRKRYALIQSTSMRSSRWKAMVNLEGERVLFDLATDPLETMDVSAENEEVVNDMLTYLGELMARYEEMARRFEGKVEVENGPRIEITPEERARLEALGYHD